ncbi:MAG: hypothetical protein QOF79_1592 [Actinomycetota bacterium]|jgi:peptidoglycan/LPS O-acetylase OafA/YrhL|nr:hypothetical protein [Actinomycetota bacterium]
MTEIPPGSVAQKPGAARATAAHLYEVDIVRILTFVCVIGVHTISHTVAPTEVPLYLLLALLHFTRNVFFALTAFVLVYSYLHRPKPMREFWPKRFLLVGVPYLAWSAIYFVASTLHSGTTVSFGALVLRFLGQVVTGVAWYHLYFLLVTMQVYLLLPVILWVVRKSRGHHTLLLSVSGVIQLALIACYFYWPAATALINHYNKQYFFSYQFFILAGAVAADHSATFLLWVREHRPRIAVLTGIAAALTIAVYFIAVATGVPLYDAGTPLQPVMMVWALAVCLAFLAIGTWWADRRNPAGLGTRFVKVASDRSFGIFLSHPLAIWFLLWVGDDFFERTIPTPWLTLVIYLLVIASAIAITEVARRTPLSLPLTGRPWRAKRSA